MRCLRWRGVVAGLAICGLLTAVPSRVCAETIYFKDGRRVEATITAKTDKGVTVEWYGTSVTYWMDEIDRIESSSPSAPSLQGGPSPASAAPADAGGSDMPEAFLSLSGFDRQLHHFSKQAQAQALQQLQADPRLASLSPEARAKLSEVLQATVAAGYQETALRQDALSAFAAHREQLQALQEPLKAPWLQQVIEADIAGTADTDGLQAFSRHVQAQPPAPQRLALANRLMTALDAVNASIDTGALAAASMRLMVDDAASLSTEQVVEAMRAKLQQQRGQLEHLIRLKTLFVYRSLSDGELERYAKFLESDLGRTYSAVGNDAWKAVMTGAAARFAQQMASRSAELKALRRTPSGP